MATVTRSTQASTVDDPPRDGQMSQLTGRVVPYATPADIGYFTEEFRRGAFAQSLAVTPNVPLLMYHDAESDPIGVATRWDDRADGLYGTFTLDRLSARAQEAARLSRDGFLTFMSIRFQPIDTSWFYAQDLGGLRQDHAVRNSARLLEVSLVSTPAYPLARVTEVRHAGRVPAPGLGVPAYRRWRAELAQLRPAGAVASPVARRRRR